MTRDCGRWLRCVADGGWPRRRARVSEQAGNGRGAVYRGRADRHGGTLARPGDEQVAGTKRRC